MKNFWIALVLGMSSSCAETPDSTSELSPDSVVKDTIQPESVLPIEARLCGPMLDIANYLDTLGYVCDSTRLETVYSFLKNNPRIYGRGHTFYTCEPTETCVTELIVEGDLPGTFDSLIYGNREPVIGYFFTTPARDEAGWYTDGIVEQWKFEDSVQARTAAQAMVLTPNVYVHNAPLMVCYVDDCMYVFYSRSTPAMYVIGPYFKEFVKRNNAIAVRREGGS